VRTASLIFGSLGGVAAVLGGLTVGGVLSLHPKLDDWMFWFVLSAVLLLSSIAFGVNRDQGE